MELKIKITKKVDVRYLKCEIGARYWEDATVNDIEDKEGTLIPCRIKNNWCPIIDLKTGKILNWEMGVRAFVHYKSCDDNTFELLDENKISVKIIGGYVPSVLDLTKKSYGDYVIMTINEKGMIQGWEDHKICFKDFK